MGPGDGSHEEKTDDPIAIVMRRSRISDMISQEKFLDICKERVLDLMKDQVRLDEERG